MSDLQLKFGEPQRLRFAGRIARAFIDSKLTPLLILTALLLGALSVWQTPREEEPQIVVPMLDVFVQMPGASAEEVAQRVSTPMEKLLREVPGVEYVYSISHPGVSLLIVRFYVGTKQEDAVVRTYNKLYSNFDRVAPGVSPPVIKSRSIDDVPIMALTLWGKNYDSYRLRRIAGELEYSLKEIDDVSETQIIGGQPRTVRVVLDTERLAAYGLTPGAVVDRLQQTNTRGQVGSFARDNREFQVEAGLFFSKLDDLRAVVLGTHAGRPVYLRDVAEKLEDGPAEPDNYVVFANGRATSASGAGAEYPAVTITLAKRRGTNATFISERVLQKLDSLRGFLLPRDLNVTITRNYRETAKDKSNELLKHLFIATLSVTLLVALALGWRESGVILLAVPVTLALTLAIFYLYGYTLNRVTLFALIFSIGILVDDAIVVVENIIRHFRLPECRGRPLAEIAAEAVEEVGNPTILATFAVIAAILPMAFVRGLMGPYMRPIPVGASAAMMFSLIVAFVVSPWAALRLLGRGACHRELHESEGWTTKLYRRLMNPLIQVPRLRWLFLGGIVVLLLAAIAFIPLEWVRVKMLPFDNKSEFQVIIDMPDGTPLEQTTHVAQALGTYLAHQPEVTNYQIYSGSSGPYNFNGLVRHYYLRHQPNQADIQVNLVSRHDRKAQSHEIARRVRPELVKIAEPFGARIKVAEVPPGPPVLETLVAEVYGPDQKGQLQLASQVKKIFRTTPGVVDVDWYVEDPQTKYNLKVDPDKAALHGISAADVTRTLQIGLGGASAGLLHDPQSREDIPIEVRLARADRSGIENLQELKLPTPDGSQIALQEITNLHQTTIDTSVYRKNLQPVVYVTGDVAGEEESPVYAIMKMSDAIDKINLPDGYGVKQYTGTGTTMPERSDHFSMKWDGEWHITVEVFRDLGLAFAVVLILIYVLVVGWFGSFKTPLVIMAPIPLTLVGILPAHTLMGAFFTATSMIGFIAGAGIIVRNSIILVDFIELRRSQGMPLEEAVVDAGAVRFRPMLLTAAAVVVGASVILFDPIFQGLALSLMAGEVASTVLSRMAVPVLYYLSQHKSSTRPSPAHELVAAAD